MNLFKLALKNITSKPLRSAVTVLAIAVARFLKAAQLNVLTVKQRVQRERRTNIFYFVKIL